MLTGYVQTQPPLSPLMYRKLPLANKQVQQKKSLLWTASHDVSYDWYEGILLRWMINCAEKQKCLNRCSARNDKTAKRSLIVLSRQNIFASIWTKRASEQVSFTEYVALVSDSEWSWKHEFPSTLRVTNSETDFWWFIFVYFNYKVLIFACID